MCHICGCPPYQSCSCSSKSNCNSCGSTKKWDAAAIIYHKDNGEISELTALNLNNGATLELILETIDDYIAQIKVNEWDLPYLDDKYLINTLQQMSVAIDTELALLNRFKGEVTADPSDLNDGDYWHRTDTDELKIQLDGATRVITIT